MSKFFLYFKYNFFNYLGEKLLMKKEKKLKKKIDLNYLWKLRQKVDLMLMNYFSKLEKYYMKKLLKIKKLIK